MKPSAWLALAVVYSGCAPSPPPASDSARAAEPTPTSAPPSATSEPAAPPSASAAAAPKPIDLDQKANELAHRFIILDGHVDVPYRLWQSRDKAGKVTEDVAERTAKGNFDYPRAVTGGLDAPFMSIYVPAKFEAGGAKKLANQLIDLVEDIAKKSPDKFRMARSTEEVRQNKKDGKISLLLGMENGSPVEKKLENVKFFFDRGVRYITLAHSKDNHLSDSSYDDRHKNKGLSPFGKQVVGEMNRLGILVDVSHISDDAFRDVMKVSTVPVIASHSSCRHFTPGWMRNMSDDMIRELASKGGVIQINFGSGFLDPKLQKQETERWKQRAALLRKHKLESNDARAKPLLERFEKDNPAGFASVAQVADHIDHVKALVGVDHVGLGSDFDGVGDSLPVGLKDVGAYPSLIKVLLERGYSDAEIEKICSGNVLRVWQRVEVAAAAQADAASHK
ncbi:MAG: dipeptidase [Myxococcales bacterium]|nr:dipeptidase [Myxococcales bacterium]